MNQLNEDQSVVLLSGGMDSTTALYVAMDETKVLYALSFDYGQRHRKELEYATYTAAENEIPHSIIDLSSMTRFLKGSALTDDVDIPEGHYAADNMSVTVVPNRNAIMLSQTVGAAVGLGAARVYAGMHAGDHPVYPDCRPEFIAAFNNMIRLATDSNVTVWTPFIYKGKEDIVRRGDELGVSWEETWSCYKGGVQHCGRCGTCVERAEAFYLANIEDPTVYADNTYWREQVGAN